MENKGAIQKGFGCVFWFLLVMSVIPAILGGYYTWQEYQTLQWEKTTAKIAEGGYFHPKGNDTGRITVEYDLDGKKYRHLSSYTIAQSSVLTNDLAMMRKYSFGANIDLFFDPLEQPRLEQSGSYYLRSHTVLKQGLSDDFYVPFIFSGVFLFGAIGFRRLARGIIGGVDKIEQKIAEIPKVEKIEATAKELVHNQDIEDFFEDKKGRVVLDNTGRAGRVMVVLVFMIILAAIYWSLISFTDASHKELQFYFAIPVVWGLVVAFAVSDSTIIRREGVLYTRRGWLFLVRKKSYMLHKFKKVLVTETDHERFVTNYTPNRKQTYNVMLEGEELVSVFVAGHYDDACQLAQRIAKHLKIDVAC